MNRMTRARGGVMRQALKVAGRHLNFEERLPLMPAEAFALGVRLAQAEILRRLQNLESHYDEPE